MRDFIKRRNHGLYRPLKPQLAPVEPNGFSMAGPLSEEKVISFLDIDSVGQDCSTQKYLSIFYPVFCFCPSGCLSVR